MRPQLVISAEEKARRQQVVESALSSLRLEGFEASSEALVIVEQFKRGEISLEEMGQAIDVRLRHRPVHIPE